MSPVGTLPVGAPMITLDTRHPQSGLEVDALDYLQKRPPETDPLCPIVDALDDGTVEVAFPLYAVTVTARDIEKTKFGQLGCKVDIRQATGQFFDRLGISLSLESPDSRQKLAKLLREGDNETPWNNILEATAYALIDRARNGLQVFKIGKQPATIAKDYQLSPVLEKNQPTTIFSPGGTGKSYLADKIAVQVQLGIADDWIPIPGNVLYLDWEACKEDHERRVWAIKKGFIKQGCENVDLEEMFEYVFCDQPLTSIIQYVQRFVSQHKIDLVIIDSQMAASGYGPDPAQQASQYYNALRSLRCTTLTLDHVTKQDMRNDDSVGPYGSIVKYNRSRSQFELKKSQNTDDDFLELSLVHRKHNEGKLLKPIGIRINFDNDKYGNLEAVRFSKCNLADNPTLSKTLGLKDQLVGLLRHGRMETKDIAERLTASEVTVRARLNEHKAVFKHFDEGWGLLNDKF